MNIFKIKFDKFTNIDFQLWYKMFKSDKNPWFGNSAKKTVPVNIKGI